MIDNKSDYGISAKEGVDIGLRKWEFEILDRREPAGRFLLAAFLDVRIDPEIVANRQIYHRFSPSSAD
jgi:hypothetical protein